VFGALARTDRAAASVTQVAPELSSVPVDSLEYRAAETRYQASAAALADAQQIAANSAGELDRLHADDARLTTVLAMQTAARKQATVDLASARATLRTLAAATYAGSPANDPAADPAPADELDNSIRGLERRSLVDAVSRTESDHATAARSTVDTVSHSMNDVLDQRTTARQRILKVQQIQDRAAASVAQYGAAVASAQADVDRTRVTANVVGADFQLVALDAYRRAAATSAFVDPGCGIAWWALAGITRVESKHGTFGGSTLLYNGDTSQRIVGVPLDGANNTALIGDSDGGTLDGDPVFDRAVGPMQFIPSTWRRWASDGNGDGVADPNNIYDAAAAAARYLCASGPMQTDDDMTRGFLSYNQSGSYAAAVLGFAKGYATFALTVP
jgi:membrane-bound lytic murein transglycosylase B